MSPIFKSTLFFIPLFIYALGMQSCGSAQNSNKLIFEENPPFTIQKAYFQKWAGGIESAGSGLDMYVIFENLSPQVKIKNVYFRNQITELQKSIDNSNEYFANLSKKPRLDVVMDKNPIQEAQNTPNKEFPFDLKDNEAVLSYSLNGKIHYYKIPNLSEKESLAYPQSNPIRD